MGKLENLESAKWINAQPLIMHTGAAFERVHTDHNFYMVTWWGDEPAGFSQFEFTGVISGAYEITIIEESDEKVTSLEADEWVLVFQQYRV